MTNAFETKAASAEGNASAMLESGSEFQRVSDEESFGGNAGHFTWESDGRRYDHYTVGATKGVADAEGNILKWGTDDDLTSQDIKAGLNNGKLHKFAFLTVSKNKEGDPSLGGQVVRISFNGDPQVKEALIETARRYNEVKAAEVDAPFIDPAAKVGRITG